VKNIGERKRSSNRKNFKTPALHFRVNKNVLETELLENDHVPAQDFLKHKCDFLHFLTSSGESVDALR